MNTISLLCCFCCLAEFWVWREGVEVKVIYIGEGKGALSGGLLQRGWRAWGWIMVYKTPVLPQISLIQSTNNTYQIVMRMAFKNYKIHSLFPLFSHPLSSFHSPPLMTTLITIQFFLQPHSSYHQANILLTPQNHQNNRR